MDEQAVFVVRRLQNNGHEAYLVGGCVRDLLAGLEPKDFDVATDAHPNRVKRLFRSARVIGRRFRLVHVRFPGDHIIETATFRGDPSHRSLPDVPDDDELPGRRRDWRNSVENIFGTAPEDAYRRDFTINALFYDPVRSEVLDWVGGLSDLDNGLVRAIGDPGERIDEDPVRILRAVHFARRLDFELESELESAIKDQAACIQEASQARLYIELVKMLSRGRARATFQSLMKLGVLDAWLPELGEVLHEDIEWPSEPGGTHEEASQGEPEDAPAGHATWNLLGAADRFGLAAKKASESLILATLFGPWILHRFQASGGQGWGAFQASMERCFRPLALRMSVPRATYAQLQEQLFMLPQLRHPPARTQARRRLLHRASFRDALTLFELDCAARDADDAAVEDWRERAREAGVRLDGPPPGRQGRGRANNRADRGGGSGGRRTRGGRSRGGRGRSRGGRGRSGGGRSGRGRGSDTGGSSTAGPEAGAWTPPPPPKG